MANNGDLPVGLVISRDRGLDIDSARSSSLRNTERNAAVLNVYMQSPKNLLNAFFEPFRSTFFSIWGIYSLFVSYAFAN